MSFTSRNASRSRIIFVLLFSSSVLSSLRLLDSGDAVLAFIPVAVVDAAFTTALPIKHSSLALLQRVGTTTTTTCTSTSTTPSTARQTPTSSRSSLLHQPLFGTRKPTPQELCKDSAFQKAREEEWFRQLENLKEFQQIHGHCNVPVAEGRLGNWVSTQRSNYKNDRMREDRKPYLDDIGFIWNLQKDPTYKKEQREKKKRMWQEKREQKRLEEQSGNYHHHQQQEKFLTTWGGTPIGGKGSDESTESFNPLPALLLGGMMARRDSSFDDLDKLDVWGFDDDDDDDFEDDDDDDFEDDDDIDDDDDDGEWNLWGDDDDDDDIDDIDDDDGTVIDVEATATTMLQDYGFNNNKNSNDDETQKDEWFQQYETLRAFQQERGHCNVPSKGRRYASLRTWMNTQRTRMNLLEEIGFLSWHDHNEKGRANEKDWDQLDDSNPWEYERRRSGPFPPPSVSSPSSSSSLSTSKSNTSQQKTPQQIKQDQQWLEQLENLKAFEKRHGHANVPENGSGDDARLGRWVNTQRKAYKEGRMRQDREMALNTDIEGFIWDREEATWLNNYAKLKQYKEYHGSFDNLSLKDYLGRWVNKQHQLYNGGELQDERIDLLTDLDFFPEENDDFPF